MSDAASVRPLRSVEWVAARLGVSRWQVYELAKRGEIPHVKLGRLVRFDEAALEAFIRGGGIHEPRNDSIERVAESRVRMGTRDSSRVSQ
jgi:excisionase family DNA binding protein